MIVRLGRVGEPRMLAPAVQTQPADNVSVGKGVLRALTEPAPGCSAARAARAGHRRARGDTFGPEDCQNVHTQPVVDVTFSLVVAGARPVLRPPGATAQGVVPIAHHDSA